MFKCRLICPDCNHFSGTVHGLPAWNSTAGDVPGADTKGRAIPRPAIAVVCYPAITLNGQPLQELTSTPAKTGFTLTLSSAALKAALKRGTNDFTFTSAASVTVTALSVRVVP